MNTSPPPADFEGQTGLIERLLAEHGQAAHLQGGRVLPRWIRFRLEAAVEAEPPPGLAEALALTLGLPGARLARRGRQLFLDLPRPDPQPVYLSNLLLRLGNTPAFSACLGLDEDNTPLLARLPAPEVQSILVAGEAGAGKTELLRAMLASLVSAQPRQARLQLALSQARPGPFDPLAGLPHLIQPPATGSADSLALLFDLAEEAEQRQRHAIAAPRIVLAIDDLDHLLARGGRRAESMLAYLLEAGPDIGLHILAATRRPEQAALGPLLTVGFHLRLAGRLPAEAAEFLLGADSGAEQLLGQGDFLALANGQLAGFQAAWVTPDQWDQLLDQPE